MKYGFVKLFMLVLILLCHFFAYSQLKIWPQNKTLIGPNWWTSWPTLSNVGIFINGKTEIAPTSSSSTFSFENYHNSTGDDPGIIPQFNYSLWVGSPYKELFHLYAYEVDYENLALISDEKVKTNIKVYDNLLALNKIKSLKTYTYDVVSERYKSVKNQNRKNALINENKNKIGFLAQEIKTVFPQFVTQEDDSIGLYRVNYVALIPVLVEAIKAQQSQIDSLGLVISQLNKKVK